MVDIPTIKRIIYFKECMPWIKAEGEEKLRAFHDMADKAVMLAGELNANVFVETLPNMSAQIKLSADCFWFLDDDINLFEKKIFLDLIARARIVCLADTEHNGRRLTEITLTFDLCDKIRK